MSVYDSVEDKPPECDLTRICAEDKRATVICNSCTVQSWRTGVALVHESRAEEHESRARRTCYSSVQVC